MRAKGLMLVCACLGALALVGCDDSEQGNATPPMDTPDAGDPSDAPSLEDADPEDATPDTSQPDPEPDTDFVDVDEPDVPPIEEDVTEEDAVEDIVEEVPDPQPVCGDGTAELGEACDDNNTDDGDYCSSDCTAITGACGDGDLQDIEVCDDNNTEDGDYCNTDCSIITGTCGDGTPQTNEACDDGNTGDGDYCSADCTAITGSCGDGVQQTIETCDDGATEDCTGTHDGGNGACVPEGTCANGFVLDGQGQCVSNPTGLTTPCSSGPGWTLFKFHYDDGSTSARIDVWDATCEYSFAPNSACNVRQVYPGFGDLDRTPQGDYIVNSREYIRVRFRVNGLNFSRSTVYFQARSYSTCCSTDVLIESPLYGARAGGPIDNDFTFDWYGLDWTGFLSPSDQHGLTAIQIFAQGGSNSLAIRAVELCVE